MIRSTTRFPVNRRPAWFASALLGLLAFAIYALPPDVFAAVNLSGKAGGLNGNAVLRIPRLGRERLPQPMALKIANGFLSADGTGGFRLSGSYQANKSGIRLTVTHDEGSAASLIGLLSGRAQAIYSKKTGGSEPVAIAVSRRKTSVTSDRKARRATLAETVVFTVTVAGKTYRGTYNYTLKGALADFQPPVDRHNCATPNDEVACALNALGVSIQSSPRVDNEGTDLPEGETPLGTTLAPGRTMELLFVGPPATFPSGTTAGVSLFEFTPVQPPPGQPVSSFTPSLLHAPTGSEVDWAKDDGFARQTRRTAAAADIDNDGRQEVVAIHMDGNNVMFRVIDDKDSGFATTATLVTQQAGVRDLSAIGGDFNGDGRSEIAVAFATDSEVRVLVFGFDGSRWLVQATKSIRQRQTGTLSTSIKSGNLDNDRSEELAVVVNEGGGGAGNPSGGLAHYAVFDDAASGFAELRSEILRIEANNIVVNAVVADLSLGDVDGDGRDELVFGGLAEYTPANLGNNCGLQKHLLIVLDDAKHGLARLSSKQMDYRFPNCGDKGPWYYRYVHVNTPNLDGDGVAEIQVNHFIFDDFANAAPWTPITAPIGNQTGEIGIPSDRLFEGANTRLFDRSTSAIAVADVTGDGRDDIVLYVQDELRRAQRGITVWSLDQVRGWVGMAYQGGIPVPVAFENFQNPTRPILLPVDIDRDGPVLKYSDAEYKLVFTEPTIIAALAAPPCLAGEATNGDCRTTYGTSETTTGGIDGTVRVFARATVGVTGGFKIFGTGVEAELTKSVTAAASLSAKRSYALEQSIVFSTGPMEDGVVFTSVPLDTYTYTVLSHPIPDLVGEKVTIYMPRRPITLLAERDYYNRNVTAGSTLVGSDIFRHTIGNPRTYPARAEKDQLLRPVNATGAVLNDLLDQLGLSNDLVGKLLGGGIASDRVSVGQGGGNTAATLRFSQSDEYRAGAEISYEVDARATAGAVIVGGAVGGSVEAGLSWGSESATVYSGTVGSLSAANFGPSQYNFGLFTYIHNAGQRKSRQFEVVNYWVE